VCQRGRVRSKACWYAARGASFGEVDGGGLGIP
jgi:hypothetical protein